MAVTFDIEGMRAINGDLARVENHYRLEKRHTPIACNLDIEAGGGCHDDDYGLADFGRAVITETNRVGMAFDNLPVRRPTPECVPSVGNRSSAAGITPSPTLRPE